MPTPELNAFTRLLLRLRNAVDYPLRQNLRLQRGGLKLYRNPEAELFAGYNDPRRTAAQSLAARLIDQYHLQDFRADSSPVNFRENLFYLHMLENALELAQPAFGESLQAADIGVSHWFYVQALAAGLRWWRCPTAQGRQLTLHGYEVDAYRVYADFHSRYDHALAHMRAAPGVSYCPREFATQPGAFDLVTLFFPFVFDKDHLRWGLPLGQFDPDRLMQSAWDSLKPGGLLLIVNQGADEHQAQGKLLRRLEITPCGEFRQDNLLFQYPYERYLWLALHP
jgi:SAM-dependent methyltransferase